MVTEFSGSNPTVTKKIVGFFPSVQALMDIIHITCVGER